MSEKIEVIIDKLLKEPIAHYLGDSGGAYGYIYERNYEEGYLQGLNPVDEYTNEEQEDRTLDVTIPVYDFLKYNLVKDAATIGLEEQLFDELEAAGIDPASIYEVEDFLNGGEFSVEIEHDIPVKYVNTYNGEEFLSQTLLFCTFSTGLDWYLLLEVHNGCDVRSGYTTPQLFRLKDIDYFYISQIDRFCQCECGLNNYTICGTDEPTDTTGNYVDGNEIYKRTFIDNEGNVRCKKCNDIIKGGFKEW